MPTNSAQILYCGHSTVIITSERGKKIIIDPWLEGNPKCPQALFSPGPIDYILLTHGHSDHTGSVVLLAKSTGASVFATFELATLIANEGVPAAQIQYMNKGGSVRIPDSHGLVVTLTNAFHSSSFDASDGKTYYAGEACGVVLTLESGRTIYHAGDTCLFEDMKQIGKLYQPTVALLPIGDRFTMGPQAAADAVDLIKPQIAIPIHYATFEMLTGTAEEFEALLEMKETKAVILKPGEKTSL